MKKIWAYHITVFLSAFLLFQVQPMTSKALLPLFGGSYLVWGACMFFYQAALLAGYFYAHVIQRRMGVFRYSRRQWILLLAPLAFFPFDFENFSSVWNQFPLAVSVFGILLISVGLPFLALSTMSLVLQKWLAQSNLPERGNPYVLYGASNLGSVLALLTYPVLVEPFVSLKMQGYFWWGGYLLLLVLHLFCLPTRPDEPEDSLDRQKDSPGFRALAVWFLFSLAACSFLLAVTNVITFDIASVPFLWVLPLAVYLFSFVLTFKRNPWYPTGLRRLLDWAVMVGILLHLMTQLRMALPASLSIVLHLGILFVVCQNCAGSLIRAKPSHDRHLTTFYLILALGGVTGSLLVSWVIPVISRSLIEYPLSLVLVMFALGIAGGEGKSLSIRQVAGHGALLIVALAGLPWLLRWCGMAGANLNLTLAATALPALLILLHVAGKPFSMSLILLCATAALTWTEQLAMGLTHVKRLRNFYGIYRIYDKGNLRYLQHGTTQHGRQYRSGPEKETPLAYFHPSTPAAGVLQSPLFQFRDIGMIGLGTGALAAYARAGQTFTIYELDPDNIPIAEEDFSYLSMARRGGANVISVVGDGRISLRGRESASLDVLIIDAFNSGSIPVHLLTVEAFTEYFRVLRPEGILLLHVSNKILDLVPVVFSNARSLGVDAFQQTNAGNVSSDAEETSWMALSCDEQMSQRLVREGWYGPDTAEATWPRPWTDQYSHVLGALWQRR